MAFFLDTILTPYTMQLWLNIDRAMNKQNLDQVSSNAAEILYSQSYKKLVPDLSRPIPDAIVFPGHVLVYEVTAQLFHFGAPDRVKRQDFGAEDGFFNIIERGARYSGTYAAMLSVVGKYILNLWLVNCAWWRSESGLWIFDPQKRVEFGIEHLDDGRSSLRPEIRTYATGLEWSWLLRFISLAGVYEEVNLNLIPYYWPGTVAPYQGGVPLPVEIAKQDPVWAKRRAELEQSLTSFPYSLRAAGNEDGDLSIIAKAQHKPQDLISRTMYSMGMLETILRQSMDNISHDWEKLRASHELQREDIDDDLHNTMRWVVNEWQDFFLRDSMLSTTAQRMTYIDSWREESKRKRTETLRRDIERPYKRIDDHWPGKKHVEKEVPPEPEKAALKVISSDLPLILREAWPLMKTHGRGKTRAKIKQLELQYLNPGHLNFSWKKVKANDRLDLCTKIIQKYLEVKFTVKYDLKSLRRLIKENLPK
jgi:hypothetical protein